MTDKFVQTIRPILSLTCTIRYLPKCCSNTQAASPSCCRMQRVLESVNSAYLLQAGILNVQRQRSLIVWRPTKSLSRSRPQTPLSPSPRRGRT